MLMELGSIQFSRAVAEEQFGRVRYPEYKNKSQFFTLRGQLFLKKSVLIERDLL